MNLEEIQDLLMAMRALIHFFYLFLILFLTFGCQSRQSRQSEVSQVFAKKTSVKARAKIQFKDLKKGDVHYLDLDILAQNESRLRMDVRATLGILVASIAIQGKEVSYIIPSRKKMFNGPATENSFKPLGALQLHPFVFYSLIFDESLRYGDWKCKSDQNLKPRQCDSKLLMSSVEWTDRSGGLPRILISNPNFEMTWVLKSIEEDASLGSSDFTLKMPSDYSAHTIPLN